MDHPNSPGLWKREGKEYLVSNQTHVSINEDGDFVHGCVADLPTGGWQKLDAEPEQPDKLAAVTEKLEKYKRVLIENQDFCGAAAIKDCLQLLNGFEPKLLSEVEDQIAGLKETIARQEEEIGFLRNELRKSGYRFADSFYGGESEQTHYVNREPTPPEVIDGRGQRVEEGDLVLTSHEWKSARAMLARIESVVQFGQAYDAVQVLKQFIPEPPRPAFVAPPKPEQFLIRRPDGEVAWTTKANGLFVQVIHGEQAIQFDMADGIEILDPLTGEPAEEAKG